MVFKLKMEGEESDETEVKIRLHSAGTQLNIDIGDKIVVIYEISGYVFVNGKKVGNWLVKDA